MNNCSYYESFSIVHWVTCIHTHRLLIPHADVPDAQLLGGNGDFRHWDAHDAKHVLDILGAEERGNKHLASH
jgi:hypothetical protein